MELVSMIPSESGCVHAAWGARANELAHWAWHRLVNRTDCRGAYRPLADRGKVYLKADGTEGRLGAVYTSKLGLNIPILGRHFRAAVPEHLAGAHSTSPDNRSLWAAVDVDQHGETSTPAKVNWAAALAWYERLCLLDSDPLLIDSNSCGGFHIWTLFSEPVPTERVHAFLQWLTRDHTAYGLPVRPETFPKQARIKTGGFGNWLRLPGLHHSRPHWSKVWNGSVWLAGDAAIDYLLGCHGDPPSIIPDEAVRLVRPASPDRGPSVRQSIVVSGGDELTRRIAGYLSRLPKGLGEGQNRHGTAYQFAAWLVRDMDQPDDVALSWLLKWDATNAAPLGEAELGKQLRCVHLYGTRSYGSGLSFSVRASRRTFSMRFTVRF
jgi:hypothetical protein